MGRKDESTCHREMNKTFKDFQLLRNFLNFSFGFACDLSKRDTILAKYSLRIVKLRWNVWNRRAFRSNSLQVADANICQFSKFSEIFVSPGRGKSMPFYLLPTGLCFSSGRIKEHQRCDNLQSQFPLQFSWQDIF